MFGPFLGMFNFTFHFCSNRSHSTHTSTLPNFLASTTPHLHIPCNPPARSPFSRFSIMPIGGRSTAVKLSNGDVWVMASTPLDEPTKETLARMGTVKYIIGADSVHHLYLGKFTLRLELEVDTAITKGAVTDAGLYDVVMMQASSRKHIRTQS